LFGAFSARLQLCHEPTRRIQVRESHPSAKNADGWGTRPVVVLTRTSAIAYLSTVTVAPITSTIRGVPSEVVLNEEDGMKASCAVNLNNAVTVNQDRLGARVGHLSPMRMNEICTALSFSLGCDQSHS
jgi:mRNA interferase MazF